MSRFDDLKTLLKNHTLVIIVLILLLSPTIFGISYWYFSGQISALKEIINLCEAKISSLEEELEKCKKTLSRNESKEPIKKYPNITDLNDLTKDDVWNLADYYGLFTDWEVNPNMKYQEGDISFWVEKKPELEKIDLYFKKMEELLKKAEQDRTLIESKGKLTSLVENTIPPSKRIK